MRTFALATALCLVAPSAWASEWTVADADGDGYTIEEGDCADGDPEINPGVKEICEDEIDNDCDLAIDFEDPECTPCGACSASPFRTPPVTVVVIVAILLGLVLRRRRAAPAPGRPVAARPTPPASAPPPAPPSPPRLAGP